MSLWWWLSMQHVVSSETHVLFLNGLPHGVKGGLEPVQLRIALLDELPGARLTMRLAEVATAAAQQCTGLEIVLEILLQLVTLGLQRQQGSVLRSGTPGSAMLS